MRNLKRALSLALASVMMMSMMVVGAGALNFKDADDISDVTAATVLEALEIMIGDDEGNFNPDEVVTRAEMAIILCRVVYGTDYEAAGYEGITTFTDISGHWAEAEIGMAYANGWINGKSAETFDPNATVQTYEAYVMLQRALGYYDAADSTEYSLGTYALSLASKTGMSSGISAGAYVGLTRDAVATAVYNTLFETPKVAYSSWTNLYYACDVTYADGNWTPEITNPSIAIEFGSTGTFAADVHDVTIGFDIDIMGRPVDTVIVDKEVLATSAIEPTAIYVEATAIEDIQDGMEQKMNDSRVFFNGVLASGKTYDDGDDTLAGVVVEVYDEYYIDGSSNDNKATYVAYTYSYGEITDDVEYDEDDDITTIEIEKKDYIIAGDATDLFEEDDVVVFTYEKDSGDREIDMIAIAETVEGEVTAAASSYVSIDGDKYYYADGVTDLEKSDLESIFELVLDPNGFVLSTEVVEAETDVPNYLYVYVTAEYMDEYEAKVVFADGTEEIITITEDVAAGFYSWDEDDGEYELTDATSDVTTNTSDKTSILNGYNKDDADVFSTRFDDDTIYVDVENGVYYEGYEAVPDYENISKGDVSVIDDGDVVVVFIFDTDPASDTDSYYVYVAEDDMYWTTVDGDEYRVYEAAYVNGELVEDGLYSEKSLNVGVVYEVEIDTDGYVTAKDNLNDLTAATLEAATVGSKTIYFQDDADRYYYDDDTVFVLVDDDEVSIGDSSDIIEYADATDKNDEYTTLFAIYDDDNYLEYVFIYLDTLSSNR